MRALLADRGHPEVQGLSVHLAGSKGKGSTAAYLASVFEAAGHPTGLYTSPHVVDWRERITRNTAFFPSASYVRAAESLRSYWQQKGKAQQEFAEAWGGEPTTFEWLTLAAFELFRDEGVSARVWETGLGGRLDATNTQTPTAVVLTRIELEHTDILGDTVELIAGEKAGVLKPGIPAFCAPQKTAVTDVFRAAASTAGAPLSVFDEEVKHWSADLSRDGTGVRVELKDGWRLEARVPLLGQAQGLNAAVAAWVAHRLAQAAGLDDAVIRAGLETTRLGGRMQVVSRHPWVVVDGAHTAESVALLVQSWRQLFGEGGNLVFGAFEGKAVDAMAATLTPLFKRVIVTRPGTFRPSDPEALRYAFERAGAARVEVAPTPAAALNAARQDGTPVLVCGSFYLAGEVLNSLART